MLAVSATARSQMAQAMAFKDEIHQTCHHIVAVIIDATNSHFDTRVRVLVRPKSELANI
jgi:hypothetical protein